MLSGSLAWTLLEDCMHSYITRNDSHVHHYFNHVQISCPSFPPSCSSQFSAAISLCFSTLCNNVAIPAPCEVLTISNSITKWVKVNVTCQLAIFLTPTYHFCWFDSSCDCCSSLSTQIVCSHDFLCYSICHIRLLWSVFNACKLIADDLASL